MKVAISQPTYLPWLGYLDLIAQVDTFVFLDTVQFEKQSWQQRNRIKSPNGLQLLTVPVAGKGRFPQFLRNVEISGTQFRRKHLRAVEMNYGRSRFFKVYFSSLCSLLESLPLDTRLVDLNARLIEWFMQVLGIRTPLLRSSSLVQRGRRVELLASLCQTLGANCYISPIGSAGYLLPELRFFSERAVEVVFQHYEHPQYRQLFPPFCPYASTLDLIFNEGGCSLEVLRSGRRAPLLPDQVAKGRTAGVGVW
jgi:hypothetical protein